MRLLRNLVTYLVVSFVIAAANSAEAITITQSTTFGQSGYCDIDPAYCDLYFGSGRAGLTVSLSTADSWQTADVNLTFRSHPSTQSHDLYLTIGAPYGGSGLTASNFVTSSPNGSGMYYDLGSFQSNSMIWLHGYPYDSIGFSLASTGASGTVWDALSQYGMGFQFLFFGGEFAYYGGLQLTYPGITSYRIQLFDAALVPVPPAIALTLGGLGALSFFARKRKKSGNTPAKTTKVPAEA